MGHSSINTTFDLYGRLLDRSEAESVGKVDASLAVGPSVGPTGAEQSGQQRNGRSRRRRPPQRHAAAEVAT
jgi:hypothetical protein